MTHHIGYIHETKPEPFSPPCFYQSGAGLQKYTYRYQKGLPLIGITASLKGDADSIAQRTTLDSSWKVNPDYIASVAQAGGLPVVLPPIVEAVEEMVQSIDGLLLSGGSDLDPSYYGEEALPEVDGTLPERDIFEMTLLGHALERGMPVFGICRGLQVLNVALGGTLHQDLPSQLSDGPIAHRQQIPKWRWTHEVDVDEDSNLARIIEATKLRVNSLHHQAIKDLADPLIPVAHATDGVIEAMESRDLSRHWLVGVQWHPEGMCDAEGLKHHTLFDAHVVAAKRHAFRWASKRQPAPYSRVA
jgi:putative glutamine amidotransferase